MNQHQRHDTVPEDLFGTIDHFLFQNNDNGFAVFILTLKNNSTVTVAGSTPTLTAGQEVHLTGHWKFHKKFGRQFEIVSCKTQIPTSISGLKKYLGSGLIKGIGKSYAEKLVDHLGHDVLTIIEKEPHKLQQVPGIGQKRAESITKAWEEQKEIAKVMIFLQEKDISPAYAAKIYKQYRNNTLAVLAENPYRIADEIWGIGFKIADQIAQKLGFEKHAPARVTAGVLYALSSATNQGHLYCELNSLKEKTLELLELPASDETAYLLKRSLHELYDKEKIKLITQENIHYIGSAQHYYTEVGIANKIHNLMSQPSTLSVNVDQVYAQLRAPQPHEIALNEDQQKGILTCLQQKITVITGGPGTGKTTLVKKLLSFLNQEKIEFQLAAPTGRAAKRMFESTGHHASTIHRMLEFDPHLMAFTHNEKNALKLSFLIIDEASMIDVFLAHAILRAVPYHAHIVFLGDIHQLPSVGAGNILKDIIASDIVPVVRLTQIFRQAQDSLIVVNAHKINAGEFPTSFMPDTRPDFKFIKEEDPENLINHLKEILFIKLPRMGILPRDATVLTPMNRGIAGTLSLNIMLQEMLNGGQKPYVTVTGINFKVDDKVMQIRNNYDKLVFNGDIGYIKEINQEEREVTVDFDGHLVTYESSDLNELVLAYAITIHKSQGSEYPAIIVPLFMQHFTLLQRNLVYTALTRAKKMCYFVGQPKALGMAVTNNKEFKRITFLQQFLTKQL